METNDFLRRTYDFLRKTIAFLRKRYDCDFQVDELVEFASLIEEYDVGEVQNRAWKCRLADRQTLFDMQDIVTCLTYAGTDVVTVLKPLHAVAYPDL